METTLGGVKAPGYPPGLLAHAFGRRAGRTARPMSTTPTSPNLPGPAPKPTPTLLERQGRAPLRAPRGGQTTRVRTRDTLREHGFAIAIVAALALGALSLLYPSTPSYDPWAWIQWGRDILQGELNTNTGPSWKPLPVVFTTVFALFGDAAPDLWLVIARAGGVLALITCFRLASRLVGGGRAGVAAGIVAALGLLLSTYFLRNTMMGYSEGLLIAFVLFAIERHTDDHHGQAFALGFGAAMLRPEVWPFIGLYGLWLLWREPKHRVLVLGLGAATAALWLGPEWWGSGQPLRAASRATEVANGSIANTENPAIELLKRARTLLMPIDKLGILLALGFTAWTIARTRRLPLAFWIAVAAAAWVGMVAVMTQGGFAGNERYLAMPVALGCVLSGAGWASLGKRLNQLAPADKRSWAGPVIAAVLVLAAFPFAIPRLGQLDKDNNTLHFQAQLREDLNRAVDQYGGRERVLACGTPYSGAYNVAMVSWMLDMPGEAIKYQPSIPGVIFRGRSRPGVNPTPPINKAWRPVTRAGEFTVLQSCGPGSLSR